MTSTDAARAEAGVGPPAHVRARRGRRLIEATVVVALTGFAVWLRVEPLGPSSLWLDDAWAALVHRADGLDELRLVGFSAPGFALLLRTWLAVVGFSETAAQLLPFVAGTLGPAGAYLVARRLGWHRGPAVVGGLVLVSAPVAVVYATRVKAYTTEMLVALALVGLAWWLVERPRSGRRWATFLVLGGLATVLSAFLALWVAAGAAAALLRAALDRDRVALRVGALGSAGFGVAGIVWYLAVLAPVVSSEMTAYWSDHYLVLGDGLGAAAASVRDAAVGVAEGLSSLPAPLVLLALVIGAVVLVLDQPVRAVLVLAPVVGAIVLAALQLAPLGGGRTDSYLYPAFALALAGGIHAAARRLPSAGTWVLAGTVGIALLVTAQPPRPYPAQDTRPLVAELERQARPDDAILVYPATMWAYALYTSDDISIEPDAVSSWGFAPRFARPRTYVLPPGREDPAVYAPTVARLEADEQRVWLLASHWRDDLDDLLDLLGGAGFEQADLSERGRARLYRFDR